MSAWKKLPNAKHIDWVLKSMKKHTRLWQDTYDLTWNQFRIEARDQAWHQACEHVRVQGRIQAFNQTCHRVYIPASCACLALIAYDDAEKYLSMTSNELEVWTRLSEDPVAVLILPMVQVKEKLKEMELV